MGKEFSDYKRRLLDQLSPTFCGAKWFNATIWLGNGMTASCHHPPPHEIDLEAIQKNPSALHNTEYKKLVRKQMLEGKQPKECDYCWRVENLKTNQTSDRYYKSVIYQDQEMRDAAAQDWRTDVAPRTLEIAFDNNCNLACSYCNAGFSTTWAHDINKNGAYENLESDGGGAFKHNGSWAQPYRRDGTDNPYVKAFWQWWEDELSDSLSELRVTGGEPTMSPQFWRLVEWFEHNPSCQTAFSFNSNLCISKKRLNQLNQLSHSKSNITLFTSCESVGDVAEYIRDGLKYEQWWHNLESVIYDGAYQDVHVMMTINALCLANLVEFHQRLLDLQKSSGSNISFSHNILRFPSFQSVTVLPKEMRLERANQLEHFVQENLDRLNIDQQANINRTIDYLRSVEVGHDIGNLHSGIDKRRKDFVNFYTQYDRRRGKDFQVTFQSAWPELANWYTTLQPDRTMGKAPLLDNQDAKLWGKPIFDEVMNDAKNDPDI